MKSTRAAFHKIAAVLVSEGRVTAPREVETLVELVDVGQLPMSVASAADRNEVHVNPDGDIDDEDALSGLESGSDSEDDEIPLDEMPDDMVEQTKKRRASITVAVAAVNDSHGVEDFGTKGRVHAGTMIEGHGLRLPQEEDAQWPHRGADYRYGTGPASVQAVEPLAGSGLGPGNAAPCALVILKAESAVEDALFTCLKRASKLWYIG
ncbi:hypothetical protein CYMTET_43234 [Cymbomonas tetramitiformis]|uniref:Uncharacterized protein n=1 Tax=Cymbomonas tetramitiformis TaxID=36881 RepID=A0AAE0C3U5_9CHLO|nr:hypothetical protein CYMTET_43234 [Cymbomonas tetramitiformis]